MTEEIRQLTEKEKAITQRKVDAAYTSIKYNDFLRKYRELMLDNGLEMNMKQQRLKMEQELRDIEEENGKMNFMIEASEKQINEGVKIKEPVEPKEDQ